MSTNEMNYSMYNTITYPQMPQQQQSFYGQHFQNPPAQHPVPSYGTYQIYPSPTLPPPPTYNSYDHIIRSAAETLAAFTNPNELPMSNPHFTPSNSHPSSNRRPAKNFSSVTNSTRTYYCETCRIACGGHATYQAHLNGSKHKKKELGVQNQQTSVNLSSKIGVNILRCELCDITCTSSDAYKAHLDGSKHEKAMKLHRKLGKKIPSTEPQILNHPSQSNSISQSSINGSQTVSNEDQQITLSRLLENSIKPIGEEYIETTYDTTNKPILYHCKLCECSFNDIKGKDMHLKGKRHRLSYKKKVNPNFVIDNNSNNKLSSPKQKQINNNINRSNEININVEHLNTIDNYNNQVEINDDTRYLMMLHKQIVPSPNLLNIVEQFVSTVESSLKSCSDQLQTSSIDNNSSTSAETTINQSPLMGLSRIGLLGKSLMIKTDRLFHIVVICAEWPTRKLLQTIATILSDNFNNEWKERIEIQYSIEQETIELQANTTEGMMYISIALTSPSVQQEIHEDKSEEFLSKTNCLSALHSVHSTRWFQNQVSTRQHASALVRCFRYKTKISSCWQALSSETFEILIEYALSQSLSAINAFRCVLECLSGGLFLPSGPGLPIPWHMDSTKDIFDNLTNQQRNDMTQEAQNGLRLMSFGYLSKWLEQSTSSQPTMLSAKRPYSDCDNRTSIKRQCTE